MPVLERAGRELRRPPRAAIFVSRKFDDSAREAEAYREIVQLERAYRGDVVVAACDEMGVVPSHRPRVGTQLAGLPAHFFGVRKNLARLICGAYGCAPVIKVAVATVSASADEEALLAERALEIAEDRFHAVAAALEGVPDGEARLAPEKSRLDAARQSYARALSGAISARARRAIDKMGATFDGCEPDRGAGP